MSKTKFAYPNIKAEQVKKQMSNSEVAEKLNLSRVSYESKLKSGRFIASEVVALCHLFCCDLHYLFETENT